MASQSQEPTVQILRRPTPALLRLARWPRVAVARSVLLSRPRPPLVSLLPSALLTMRQDPRKAHLSAEAVRAAVAEAVPAAVRAAVEVVGAGVALAVAHRASFQ